MKASPVIYLYIVLCGGIALAGASMPTLKSAIAESSDYKYTSGCAVEDGWKCDETNGSISLKIDVNNEAGGEYVLCCGDTATSVCVGGMCVGWW